MADLDSKITEFEQNIAELEKSLTSELVDQSTKDMITKTLEKAYQRLSELTKQVDGTGSNVSQYSSLGSFGSLGGRSKKRTSTHRRRKSRTAASAARRRCRRTARK